MPLSPTRPSTAPTRRRRVLVAGALTAVSAMLALAGCSAGGAGTAGTDASGGGDADLTPLTVRMGFTFAPYNADVFTAIDKGYFADEGLKIDFKEGNGSSAVLQLMGGSGDTDIGVDIDSGTAALNISKGVPAKIAQLGTRGAPFGTMCYKSAGVDSVEDLKGHTAIVVPSESTAAILPAYLALHGMTVDDITLVNADFSNKASLFLSGNADCILGYADSELVQDRLAKPDEFGDIVSWSDDGLKLLGSSTVVSSDLAEKSPEIVDAFLRAMNKGTEDMCTDQDAAAELYNARDTTFTDADKEYTSLVIGLYCDAYKPADGSAPFSSVSDEDWDAAMSTLAEYGGLDPVLDRDEYFYTPTDVPSVNW